MTGLIVAAARARLAAAHCGVRLLGARVQRPDIQTIGRQAARAGQRLRVVSLWVNQLCHVSAAPGPPSGEPHFTTGPSELVAGLYLDGGPLTLRSAARCASIAGVPSAGTITVTDPATGAIVATKIVADGRLGVIPLPPGTYMVVSTAADVVSNGEHIQSLPEDVTVVPGKTVWQNLVVSIK